MQAKTHRVFLCYECDPLYIGINFILAMANTNLERRQKEKYGGTQEYLMWKKKSFKGFTIPGGME